MPRHWIPSDGPFGATTLDIAWMAGFIEGEGSFFWTKKHCPMIVVTQVQREPVDRCKRLAGGSINSNCVPNKPHWQRQNRWTTTGSLAIQWMMTLYVLMSPRRREQIRRVLDPWREIKPRKVDRLTCPRGHSYSDARVYVAPKDGRRRRYCHGCYMDQKAAWPSRRNRRRKERVPA